MSWEPQSATGEQRGIARDGIPQLTHLSQTQSDLGEERAPAGDRMSQLTDVPQTVYQDPPTPQFPNNPVAEETAPGRKEHPQRCHERLVQDLKAATDTIDRNWVVKPMLKIADPLLHFPCEMHELQEDRLEELEMKLQNGPDVASDCLEVGLRVLESKVDTKMRPLESKLDALESKLDALYLKVVALEAKVDRNHDETMAFLRKILDSINERKP